MCKICKFFKKLFKFIAVMAAIAGVCAAAYYAVKKFMDEFGYDNRGFNGMRDLRFNRELYIASRKNFDRMVEEGTAIL